MPIVRWFFFLIAFWSTCTVWSTDPLAVGFNAPHKLLYWTIIALLAVTLLAFEGRDLWKRRAEKAE